MAAPHSVALRFESDNINYAQLWQRVLRATHTLQTLGVQAGQWVAYKDEAVRLLQEGPSWSGTPGTTAFFRFVFE